MALGMDAFNEVMNPGSAAMGVMSAPSTGGGSMLGGLGGAIGTFLKGGYDPQNMLMDKLGVQQPGWMKTMNAMRNMGGIGFSNGKHWFGMQGGGNGSQQMLMGALAQQMGGEGGGPIVVKNESAVTPLDSGMARPVETLSYRDYRESNPLPSPGFRPMSQL